MKDLSPTASDIEQLAAIWTKGCETCPSFPDRGEERWHNDTLYFDGFFFDDGGQRIDEPTRQNQINRFRSQLLSYSNDPATHFSSLDLALSAKLLDLTSFLWGDPSTVEPLNGYLVGDVSIDQSSPSPRSPWGQLKVVSRISAVVLKLALLVATSGIGRYSLGICIRSVIAFLSELIDTGAKSSQSASNFDIPGNSILDAFLWTTWQRSVMLLYWFVLKTHLALGYNNEWDIILALRGCSQLQNLSVRANLDGWANQSHEYMCPWAFQVLRSTRASMGLDFRRFHESFSALNASKVARCHFESSSPCDGSHPLFCGRFVDKRFVKEEQSVHDESCSGFCKKLVWEKMSYTRITGSTAVSLQLPNRFSRKIRYTQVTEQTLAISHVWSHGQGSRPHVRINTCLHERYIRIAKAHGCTSYWIDSMCIPDSHDLRSEAIGFINHIFAVSKITLVCDRDLMDIDISSLTRELLTSVLVSFFVCDWNVRAWTLLEAMTGSHAIHILCKSSKTLSLTDVLIETHQTGRLDISKLCLAAQHLIPSSTEVFQRSTSCQRMEVAGCLLSHRHAT